MKNDFDDSILQARRQFDDLKNEEKRSRDLIDENKIKEVKQVITRDRKHLQMTKFHAMQNL